MQTYNKISKANNGCGGRFGRVCYLYKVYFWVPRVYMERVEEKTMRVSVKVIAIVGRFKKDDKGKC